MPCETSGIINAPPLATHAPRRRPGGGAMTRTPGPDIRRVPVPDSDQSMSACQLAMVFPSFTSLKPAAASLTYMYGPYYGSTVDCSMSVSIGMFRIAIGSG